ncbi:MAG: hypothetical protein HY043_13330 [Verrucomicrobia bacterium]|nr:hypothetical protein [Verrucomicrobiota bacterium]
MIAGAETIAAVGLVPESTAPGDGLTCDAACGVASFESVMRGVTGMAKAKSGSGERAPKAKPSGNRDAQPTNNEPRRDASAAPHHQVRARKLTAQTESAPTETNKSRADGGDTADGVRKGRADREQFDFAARNSTTVSSANCFVAPLIVAQPAAAAPPAGDASVDSGDDVPTKVSPDAIPAVGGAQTSASDEMSGPDQVRDAKLPAGSVTKIGPEVGESSKEEVKKTATQDAQRIATPSPSLEEQRIIADQVAKGLPNDSSVQRANLKPQANVRPQGQIKNDAEPQRELVASPSSSLEGNAPGMSTATFSSSAPVPEPDRLRGARREAIQSQSAKSQQGAMADGMFVAQPEDMMKTAGNGDNSSQRGEQKLPPGENPAPKLETVGRLKSKSSTTMSVADLEAGSMTEGQAVWPLLSLNGRPERLTPLAEARGAGLWPASADPLAAQISKQAIALKHFNAESMAVVLKPDSATSVFLHLRLNDGAVEVQARFERGDYASLNAGWGQVQQALSVQGIRLGPLLEPTGNHSTSTSPATFGQMAEGGGEKQSPRNAPVEALWENALPRRSSKTAARRSAQPALAGSKNWESWA